MLTETHRAVLVQDIYGSVDWRAPSEAGPQQYDFDPGTGMYVYRAGEPIIRKYPAVKIDFLPRSAVISDSLSHVIQQTSGVMVYGYGELEPIVFTVYTQQICEGTNFNIHGKLIADEYIRKIEQRIRRFWPKILYNMNAYIYEAMPFSVADISSFFEGTEMQGFELTAHLVTTNKWTFEDQPSGDRIFEDAAISGVVDTNYMETYISVSGEMT